MRAKKIIFTPSMDELLISLYADTGNQEITRVTGWSTSVPKFNADRLGLRKTKTCKAKLANATEWSETMVEFLKDNYLKLSNQQLADALGLRKTVTRNKLRALGLCRIDLDLPWNEEQTKYLLDHYQTTGDVEIAEQLQKLFPRKRLWTKKHVNKKRQIMALHRTAGEIAAIVAKHTAPGGRMDTIVRNSSSTHLQDGYVASLIAWRDKELQKEIIKYPELIDLKRNEILLNRAIKEVQHA